MDVMNQAGNPETELPASENPEQKNRSMKDTLLREVFDWAEAIMFSLAFVILFFTFVFRIVGVEGDSMMQTLFTGDRVVLVNFGYTPKRGDVVVISRYSNEQKPLIKRIIAVAGDTVDMNYETNHVVINGEEIEEPYINPDDNIMQPNDLFMDFPYEVPPDCVFVMGDNRNASLDSRSTIIGALDKGQILGKAVFRLYRAKEYRSNGGFFGKIE